MSCHNIEKRMLWVLLFASTAYRTFAYPHLSDIYSRVKSIPQTGFLTSHDTSIPDTASYLFLSENLTSIDEVFLEFPNSTLDESTQPGQKFRTFSKSSSSSNQIPADSLHLKSDNRSIVAVNGETLYASPINSTELLLLLLSAHDDLSAKSEDNSRTSFYQFNHTNWSFDVAVATGTLRYAAILAVVARFLRLFPSQNTPPIIWSRVGCVYNYKGGEPIADIAILPLNGGDEHLTFPASSVIDASHFPPTPVRVLTISPKGVTNSTEIISPQALDVYKTDPATTLPKRQLGGEVLMRVFNTGFYLTVRILRDDDGFLHRTAVGLMMVPVLIALGRWALGVIAGLLFPPRVGDELAKIYRLESGSYRLGHLTARFLIKATGRDRNGRLVALKSETYKTIANAILEPLIQLNGGQEPIYSMGGEVLGPDSVNGTEVTVKRGVWELRVEENFL